MSKSLIMDADPRLTARINYLLTLRRAGALSIDSRNLNEEVAEILCITRARPASPAAQHATLAARGLGAKHRTFLAAGPFMQRGVRQMNSIDLGGYALSSCLAAAILAGCGGSQPPIGAPGAMLQSRAIPTQTAHGGSWMLPEAKGEDLLYVASSRSDQYSVSVFSYRSGKLVGQLKGFSDYVSGLCSDSAGDVFRSDV